MKLLLTILFLSWVVQSNAQTYHFSMTDGDDSRTATQAQNPLTPWRTIAKHNSSWPTFQPGDSILFKRGDTWIGEQVIPNKNGSAGNIIFYGAYGSGAKPVWSGQTTITAWTSLGGNIYESTGAVPGTPAVMNMVTIDDVSHPMGRYPNIDAAKKGHLNIDSHVGSTSITENAIPEATTDWAQARAVIRIERWFYDTITITNHVGNTLTLGRATTYQPKNNYGFFIENDARTLDQHGEWYYNIATDKIRIYLSAAPANYTIRVSNTPNLLSLIGDQYLTFDNISLKGAGDVAINISGNASHHLTFNQLDVINTGSRIVDCDNSAQVNLTFTDCYFYEANGYGLDLRNAGNNQTVTGCTIKRIALFVGMNGNTGAQCCVAVSNNSGDNHVFEDNILDSLGWSGIRFNGDNVSVQRNLVNNFCMTRDDGGGIYWYGSTCCVTHTNRVVKDNIVLNGWGAPDGVSANTPLSVGIYSDDNSSGAEVSYNTAYNNTKGSLIHNSWDQNWHHNTTYKSGDYGMQFIHEDEDDHVISGITYKHNINIITKTTQYPLGVDHNTAVAGEGSVNSIGTIDSNYYLRPLSEGSYIRVREFAGTAVNLTLAQWQANYIHDDHTEKSPTGITYTAPLDSMTLFEYNASNSDKTIQLTAQYKDAKGITYNPGDLVIAPWQSVVLFETGVPVNVPPTSNAGADIGVTLPTSTATLDGTGSFDTDGTITSYAWTKISGPSVSITSPSASTTGLTALLEGSYVFRLTVTDNSTAADIDDVVVIVAAAPNSPPVSRAGSDMVITLPVSSVNLDGTTSSDADGTITVYEWVKISGPAATIVSPSASTTSVTGLVQGTYVFELTVTDDDAASSEDQLIITVNAALPPPTGIFLKQGTKILIHNGKIIVTQ